MRFAEGRSSRDIKLQLAGFFVAESDQECESENLHIAPQRPVFYVVQIVLDAPLERGVSTPAVHLRPTRHPRLYLVSKHIFGNRFTKLFDQRRPLWARTHQTHFAA